MDEIKCDLQDINPYVNSLQHFRSSPSSSLHVVELKDFSSNHDFTAVMHAANTTIINPHSILICRHGDPHPQAINILSHHYEPLHYVLLFPHGEIGWGASDVPHIPHLSQIDWYRSRLLADNNDPFTNFGRLCCEYLVDMYSCTEEQRLMYTAHECQFHTQELLNAANEHPEDVNVDIKLPASFVGSCAWMSEQAADAMALGQKFGKPTFFCTMTFNSDWQEI